MLVHGERDMDNVVADAGVAADVIIAEATTDAANDLTVDVTDILFPLWKRF